MKHSTVIEAMAEYLRAEVVKRADRFGEEVAMIALTFCHTSLAITLLEC